MSKEIYCPSCGQVGEAKIITPGYLALEVALWFFFIVPGIIYSIWRLAARYEGCPNCEQIGLVPVDSPVARSARRMTLILPEEPTRKCPFCAEAIKAEAKLCRFCKSQIEPVLTGTAGR